MRHRYLVFAAALLAVALWAGARVGCAAENHGNHPAAEAETGEGGQPNLMGWDRAKTDLALWTLVIFVILLLAMARFAWGPISEGLDKREKHISGQIADAEQQNKEAQRLLAEYQQKLAQSHDEVRAILDQGRRDAEQAGRALIDKAREEIQRDHQQALHEIEVATDAASKELAERSALLAVELAGRIVRAKLTAADHQELIQQAVAQFAQTQPGRN